MHPPGTLEPVIVVEHHFLKTFFEVEEYEKQEKLLDYSIQSWQEICLEKIVWIPYHSIGKEQGVLPLTSTTAAWCNGSTGDSDSP